MTSARRFYRIVLGVAALGLVAAAAAVAVAASNVTLLPRSSAALWDACQRLILPHLTPAGIGVLLLTLVGTAVVVIGLRSLIRQVGAQRRYRAKVHVCDHMTVRGVDAGVFTHPEPQAFCAGLVRPRIFVSTGAVRGLSPAELEAVLMHERHHLVRRDPLRILLARALGEALFFVPAVKRLARRYEQLAEVAADEAAIAAVESPGTLASALLTFGERGAPSVVVGIAPERVDHLLGSPPRWRLPRALLAASLVAAAALIVFAAAVSMSGSSADLNLPMLAARSCMLLMVALPVGFLVAARLVARPLLDRRS
jgi:Zn-dependent protease with chaperone function